MLASLKWLMSQIYKLNSNLLVFRILDFGSKS